MGTVKRRTPAELARGFLFLCHPIPVLFHTLAVTLFALLAAWPGLVWSTIVLVVAAHAAMQLAIAVLNDYCDRRLDAISKRSKPIVMGLVRPREALTLGLLTIVLMVILLIPLNPLALLLSLLYLTFGLSYNLGLKSTPLSGIVFALAIPLIPVYAFVGVGHIVPFIFWFIPIAALLGIVLNLANSLPDIEEDAANHAHTLAIVLGTRGTFIVCSLFILLAELLMAILAVTHTIATQLWLFVPTLIITSLLLGCLSLLFGPKTEPQKRQTYFYLIVLTCLVLAGGWLLSILI